VREESNLVFEAEHARKVTLAEYDPQQIESKWQKIWEEHGAFNAVDGDALAQEVLHARNAALSLRHSAHGPHAQLHDWRRGGALQAALRIQTCCIRWAGMRSVCLLKMRPSSTEFIRANGPTQISKSFAACCAASDSATTGGAKFRVASRNITAGISGFFLRMLEKGIAISQEEQSELVPRMCQPCSPMSR